MHTFLRDLRYSVRMLLKSPTFTPVAVLSIALGIGANTAVFSVINSVLLKPLPFKAPQTLMLVWGSGEEEGLLRNRNQVSATDVADFRKQNTVFDEVVTVLPLSDYFDGRGLVVEDHPKPKGEEISVDLYVTTLGYLRALEIPLRKG